MIRVIIVKLCLRYIAETLFKYCVWIILYLVTELVNDGNDWRTTGETEETSVRLY